MENWHYKNYKKYALFINEHLLYFILTLLKFQPDTKIYDWKLQAVDFGILLELLIYSWNLKDSIDILSLGCCCIFVTRLQFLEGDKYMTATSCQ